MTSLFEDKNLLGIGYHIVTKKKIQNFKKPFFQKQNFKKPFFQKQLFINSIFKIS